MEEALFRITITSASFLQNWFKILFNNTDVAQLQPGSMGGNTKSFIGKNNSRFMY